MSRIGCALLAVGLVACTATRGLEHAGTALAGAAPDGSTGVVYGLYEGSEEALAILRVANHASPEDLAGAAGLTKKAAGYIVAARAGDESAEQEIGSLGELVGIPHVKRAAVRALFRYAERRGELGQHTRRPAAERIVAIGDLHGDLEHAREVLQLAGATDEEDRWIGGDLVVVQVGDVLDRGDGERPIIELLDRLADEASSAGGALVVLLGNHEIMNVVADYRYVTDGAFDSFDDLGAGTVAPAALHDIPLAERGRAAAFLPGGPVARWLARHDVAVTVGDTLFVHAGLLPEHADHDLGELNHDAREWMLIDDLEIPALLDDEDGPVWTRAYATDEDVDCEVLQSALERFGVHRMVIGHTVQEDGVTSACDDRLFRVDVGLSAYYGGPVQALEIEGATTSVLSW